ncbi:Acireductone dioxygenase [compost metagenome]
MRFERWAAEAPIQSGASHEQVIAAYQRQIDTLMTERGYTTVDVINMNDEHPQKSELLNEHRVGEDVVRFFVAGCGLYNLHIDDYVYAVLCEKGDMILVPTGTDHWFDMGENPHFVAIRLCNNPQGLAEFTGQDIAKRFPRLDD